jgi:hypothetical protein
MAVTALSIYQDNTVGDSNLMPIHSPLVFIIDVTFTGTAPELICVDIIKNSVVLDTYQLIPWRDRSATQRVFVFVANEPIRSLMGSFDDTLQLLESLEPVSNITYDCILDFYDPATTINDTLNCVFIHGTAQFSEHPNLHEIFNNEIETYYAAKDSLVYIYIYNDNAANTIDTSVGILTETYAREYNDEIFTDYNDDDFLMTELIYI